MADDEGPIVSYDDDYIDDLLVNADEKTKQFARSIWKRRDKFQKLYLITSQDSGLQYLVGKKRDGEWECSCLGYQMYGKYHRLKKYLDVDPSGSRCKHILFVERNEDRLQPFYDATLRDSGIVIMNAFSNYFSEDEVLTQHLEGEDVEMDMRIDEDFPDFGTPSNIDFRMEHGGEELIVSDGTIGEIDIVPVEEEYEGEDVELTRGVSPTKVEEVKKEEEEEEEEEEWEL